MQSFLVVAKDKNLTSSYTSNFLKEKGVDAWDIYSQIYEKAMGIEDVRNIQKAILLKPFRGRTKAVVIEAYESITTEAQNALLKVLEEPPANTIIIISTQKKELLLPTILSRCKIIELREKESSLINEDSSEFSDTLNIVLNGRIGDKLKIVQNVTKDKEQATLWLEKMAIFVRKELAQNNNIKYLNFLKELQKTYKVIKSTNVSHRTALENLFLSL